MTSRGADPARARAAERPVRVGLLLACGVWLAAGEAVAQASDAWLQGAAARLASAPPDDSQVGAWHRAEAVRALRAFGPALAPSSSAGAQASLESVLPFDGRHAAWRAESGTLGAVEALLAVASPGGGFARVPHYAADPTTTADALVSLAGAAWLPRAAVEAHLGALLRLQRPDGGFSATGGPSDLPTTAFAVRALAAWGPAAFRESVGPATARLRAFAAPSPLYEALRADALSAADALDPFESDAIGAMAVEGAFDEDVQATAAAVRVLAAARPDLTVERLAATPPRAVAGASVEIEVEVRNEGGRTASAFDVSLWGRGGVSLGEQRVGPIAAGDGSTVRWAVDAPSEVGAWHIEARVDPADVVVESDEANNEASLRVRLTEPIGPDLSVSSADVRVDPPTPEEGNPFALSAEVRNVGDAGAAESRVRFARGDPALGGEILGVVDVPALGPGERARARVDIAGRPAASFRLFVDVLPAEPGHAGNDRAVRTVRVVHPADLTLPPGAISAEPGAVVGVGVPWRARVRVVNSGAAVAPPTRLRLTEIGGGTLDETDVPALGPGDGIERTLGFVPDVARTWRVQIQADADQSVVEANEADNVAIQLVDAQSVDLTLDVRDASTGIWPGEPLAFGVTVWNTGNIDAPGTTVEARLGAPGGPLLGLVTVDVPAAPYGGRASVVEQVRIDSGTLAPGSHRIFVVADGADRHAELDEQNNDAAFEVMVWSPWDVRPSITFDPPEPEPGTPVTIHWRVESGPFTPVSASSRVRLQQGSELLYLALAQPGDAARRSGSLIWTAPERRGPVPFRIWAEDRPSGLPGRRVDAQPDNDIVDATLVVGGPAIVTSVRLVAADGESPAVEGSAARVLVEVDGPAEVRLGDEALPADVEAPAVFPWTGPAAGFSDVSPAANGRVWAHRVESRAAVPPGEAPAVVPEPAGNRVVWGDRPAWIERGDGVVLGGQQATVATEPARVSMLAGQEAVVRMDRPGYAAGATVTSLRDGALRVEVRDGRTWRPLFEGSIPAGESSVTWAATFTDAVRLRLVSGRLRGFAPQVVQPVAGDTLDALAPHGPARYRVVPAAPDGTRGPASPWVGTDNLLPPPDLAVDLVGGHATLRWTPPPPRVAGYLVRIDGAPEPDVLVEAAPSLSWSPAGLPASWVAESEWSSLRARLATDGPRPLSVAALEDGAAPGWRAEFEPGQVGPIVFERDPQPGDIGALHFDAALRGPPVIDPATGTEARWLRADVRTVSLVPLDATGQAGPPVEVAVSPRPPAGLEGLSASVRLDVGGPVVALEWSPTVPGLDVEIAHLGEVVARVPGAGGGHELGAGDLLHAVVALAVAVVDPAGNRAPTQIVAVDLGGTAPEGLDVVVDGFDVHATWDAGDETHFFLYMDGAQLGQRLGPFDGVGTWSGYVPTPGPHTISVAASRPEAGFRSGPVAFEIVDDGAPPAPALTPLETWWRGTNHGLMPGLAVVPRDLHTTTIAIDDAEPLAFGPTRDLAAPFPWFDGPATRFLLPFHRGRVALDLRFEHLDHAGRPGPPTTVRVQMPRHPAPSLALAAPYAHDGRPQFTFAGLTAPNYRYWLYHDGVRVCDWRPTPGGRISSTNDGEDFVTAFIWRPAAADPAPWIGLEAPPIPPGNPIRGLAWDRLTLAFASDETRAVDYRVQVRGAREMWRDVAVVRDNPERRRVHRLPESPRAAGDAIRILVERTPGPSPVVVELMGEVCDTADTVDLRVGGRHVFTARSIHPEGEPTAHSAPLVLDAPLADAVVDRQSVVLSDDEPRVGDVVSLVVPVENPTAADIDALVVEVAWRGEGVPPAEPQRRSRDLPAGETAAFVFAWTVTEEAGAFEIRADPDGAVPELREDNNEATRWVASDMAYRTQAYSLDRLVIFGDARRTRWRARANDGRLLASGELAPEDRAEVELGAHAGVVHLTADEPFAAVAGAAYVASGFNVRGARGGALATRFATTVPRASLAPPTPGRPEDDRVVVHAPTGARVDVTDLSDGRVLLSREVGAGETVGLDVQQRGEAVVAQVVIEADAPILAWAYGDLGFVFAGADGKLVGTELHGFYGRTSGAVGATREEIAVWSFADSNRVVVERTDTGEVLLDTVLRENELWSVIQALPPSDAPIVPIRVRASGPVAAANTYVRHEVAFGYVHGFYLPAASGGLVGGRFLLPVLSGRGESSQVFAYYDGTRVQVLDPDTGDVALQLVLGRGGSVDLAEALAWDGGARGRFVVRSERPVSVYRGLGAASAAFVPLLFAHPPDLRIGDVAATPPRPGPGETVRIDARVHNDGASRARRVTVRVYEGEPAHGSLLAEQAFERVDQGVPLPLTLELTAGEGEQVLHFVVDPDDEIAESDETNNQTRFGIANAPDVVVEAIAVVPAAPLVVGAAVDVAVHLGNAGGQPTGEISVELVADGELVGRATAEDIAPHAAMVVRLPWRPAAPGPIALVARADPDGALAEAREDNNVLDRAVDVAPAHPNLSATVDVVEAGACTPPLVRVEVWPTELPVAVGLLVDGVEAARATTRAGVTHLRSARPLAAGSVVEVILDPDDAWPEVDETDNRSPVPLENGPATHVLLLTPPAAPVRVGRVVEVEVAGEPPLPDGAMVRADGFPPARVRGGVARLVRTAEIPGRVPVDVSIVVDGRAVGCGSTAFTVTTDAVARIGARPFMAGPGQDVRLEAIVDGLEAPGVATVRIDGVLLATFEVGPGAPERRVFRAPADGAGEHRVDLVVVVGAEQVAADRARYIRGAAGPWVRLDVSPADASGRVGDVVEVSVEVVNPSEVPVVVDRVVVAVVATDWSGVLADASTDEAPGEWAPGGARVVTVPLPTEALPPGDLHLVARAERVTGETTRRLGVGRGALSLAPPLDAAVPDPATNDAGTNDAGTSDAGTNDTGMNDVMVPLDAAVDAGPQPGDADVGGLADLGASEVGPVDAAHPDSTREDAGERRPGIDAAVPAAEQDALTDAAHDVPGDPEAPSEPVPDAAPGRDAARARPPADASTTVVPWDAEPPGPHGRRTEGCDCDAAGGPAGGSIALTVLLLGVGLGRRRGWSIALVVAVAGLALWLDPGPVERRVDGSAAAPRGPPAGDRQSPTRAAPSSSDVERTGRRGVADAHVPAPGPRAARQPSGAEPAPRMVDPNGPAAPASSADPAAPPVDPTVLPPAAPPSSAPAAQPAVRPRPAAADVRRATRRLLAGSFPTLHPDVGPGDALRWLSDESAALARAPAGRRAIARNRWLVTASQAIEQLRALPSRGDVGRRIRGGIRALQRAARGVDRRGTAPRTIDRYPVFAARRAVQRGFRPLVPLRAAPTHAASADLGDIGIPPESPPAEVDRLATPSDELDALAAALGHDPRRLFAWVHDHVRPEPYRGARVGAVGALRERRANDADAAALLVELLRRSGIPARYELVRLRLRPEQLAPLAGATDAAAAARVLATAGVPIERHVVGGQLAAVDVDHWWVRAWLPADNQPGASIYAWTPLAPLIKLAHIQLPGPADLDPQPPLDDEVLLGGGSPVSAWAHAGGGRGRTRIAIPAWPSPLLPTHPPAPVVGSLGVVRVIPASERHRVEVRFGEGAHVLDGPTTHGALLSLTPRPATGADADVIEASGGLAQAPAFAYEMRHELRVDGVVAATGPPASPGQPVPLHVDVHIPGVGVETEAFTLDAGGRYVLWLDFGHTSTHSHPLPPNADPLQLIARDWFATFGADRDRVLGSLGLGAFKDVYVGLVGHEPLIREVAGLPVSAERRYVLLDIPRLTTTPYGRAGDDSSGPYALRLIGHQGSYLEGTIPGRYLSGDGFSAQRVLANARMRGIEVASVDLEQFAILLRDEDPDDPGYLAWQIVAAALHQSDVITPTVLFDALTRDLLRRWTARIPLHPLVGAPGSDQPPMAGYIATDPETGAGAYMLAPSFNGGFFLAAGFHGGVGARADNYEHVVRANRCEPADPAEGRALRVADGQRAHLRVRLDRMPAGTCVEDPSGRRGPDGGAVHVCQHPTPTCPIPDDPDQPLGCERFFYGNTCTPVGGVAPAPAVDGACQETVLDELTVAVLLDGIPVWHHRFDLAFDIPRIRQSRGVLGALGIGVGQDVGAAVNRILAQSVPDYDERIGAPSHLGYATHLSVGGEDEFLEFDYVFDFDRALPSRGVWTVIAYPHVEAGADDISRVDRGDSLMCERSRTVSGRYSVIRRRHTFAPPGQARHLGVDLDDGHYTYTAPPDIEVPTAGGPLRFQRRYTQDDPDLAMTLGPGWRHTHEARVHFFDAGARAVMVMGDGRSSAWVRIAPIDGARLGCDPTGVGGVLYRPADAGERGVLRRFTFTQRPVAGACRPPQPGAIYDAPDGTRYMFADVDEAATERRHLCRTEDGGAEVVLDPAARSGCTPAVTERAARLSAIRDLEDDGFDYVYDGDRLRQVVAITNGEPSGLVLDFTARTHTMDDGLAAGLPPLLFQRIARARLLHVAAPVRVPLDGLDCEGYAPPRPGEDTWLHDGLDVAGAEVLATATPSYDALGRLVGVEVGRRLTEGWTRYRSEYAYFDLHAGAHVLTEVRDAEGQVTEIRYAGPSAADGDLVGGIGGAPGTPIWRLRNALGPDHSGIDPDRAFCVAAAAAQRIEALAEDAPVDPPALLGTKPRHRVRAVERVDMPPGLRRVAFAYGEADPVPLEGRACPVSGDAGPACVGSTVRFHFCGDGAEALTATPPPAAPPADDAPGGRCTTVVDDPAMGGRRTFWFDTRGLLLRVEEGAGEAETRPEPVDQCWAAGLKAPSGAAIAGRAVQSTSYSCGDDACCDWRYSPVYAETTVLRGGEGDAPVQGREPDARAATIERTRRVRRAGHPAASAAGDRPAPGEPLPRVLEQTIEEQVVADGEVVRSWTYVPGDPNADARGDRQLQAITVSTDGERAVTELFHDAAGRLVRVAQPGGRETAFSDHDPLTGRWRVRRTFAAQGAEEITRAFDALGRLTAERTPQGGAWRYTYRPGPFDGWVERTTAGYAEAEADASDVERTEVFDALGRVRILRSGAPGHEEQRWYHSDGSLRRRLIRPGLGSPAIETEFTRDARTRTRTTRAAGIEVTRIEHLDARGRVARVEILDGATDPPRTETVFALEYDALGRVVRRTERGGSAEWRLGYDIAGNLVDRRLARDLDDHGLAEQWRYDALGRLRAEKPSGAGERGLDYDHLDRVVRAVEPDGAVHSWAYRAADRFWDYTLTAPGLREAATFDRRGRPLTLERTETGGFVETVSRRSWVWSPDERGVTATFGGGDTAPVTVERVFDGLGRRVRSTVGDTLNTVMEYDGAGRLAASTAPDGVTTRWTRDGLDRVREVSVGSGGEVRLERVEHPTPWESRTTAPDGRVRVARVDGEGRPLAACALVPEASASLREASVCGPAPEGAGWALTTWRHAPEPESRTVAIAEVGPTGARFTTRRDGAGRLRSRTTEVAPTAVPSGLHSATAWSERWTYAGTRGGVRTTYTDPSGTVWREDTDASGRLTLALAEGHETTRRSFSYSPGGLLTTETDNAGRRTETERDASGRVRAAAWVGEGGALARWEYDGVGRLVESQAAAGAVETRAYQSGTGLLAERSRTDTGTTMFGFDAATGRLLRTTLPDGRVRQIESYDAWGAPLRQVWRAGELVTRVVERRYDAVGRTRAVWSPRDPEAATPDLDGACPPMARCTERAWGRVVGITDWDGTRLELTTDAAGHVVGMARAGLYFRRAVDGLGRIVGTQHAAGPWASTGYDALGRAVRTVDEVGRMSQTEFDGIGRARRTQFGRAGDRGDPDADPEWIAADAGLASVSYGYEGALGRLDRTVERFADGVERTLSVTGFDRFDRPLGFDEDGVAASERAWTVDGQPARLATPGGATYTLSHDGAGRLSRLTSAHYAGAAGPDGEWHYDAAGRVAWARLGAVVACFGYHPHGSLAGIEWHALGDAAVDESPCERLAGALPFAAWRLGPPDGRGNPDSVTQIAGERARTYELAYDAADRLCAWRDVDDPDVAIRIEYEPNGGRAGMAEVMWSDDLQTLCDDGPVGARVVRNDRHLPAGDGGLLGVVGQFGGGFDAEIDTSGAQTRLASRELDRDARGRPATDRYGADGFSLEVGSRRSVRDGVGLLGVRDQGVPPSWFSPALPGFELTEIGGWTVVARSPQGAPLAARAEAGGGLRYSAVYDPFGAPESSGYYPKTWGGYLTYPAAFGSPGLMDAGHRLYAPELGRFLSRDPVATDPREPASVDRFGFGRGNPVVYADPDGRLAILVPLAYLAVSTAVDTWVDYAFHRALGAGAFDLVRSVSVNAVVNAATLGVGAGLKHAGKLRQVVAPVTERLARGARRLHRAAPKALAYTAGVGGRGVFDAAVTTGGEAAFGYETSFTENMIGGALGHAAGEAVARGLRRRGRGAGDPTAPATSPGAPRVDEVPGGEFDGPLRMRDQPFEPAGPGSRGTATPRRGGFGTPWTPEGRAAYQVISPESYGVGLGAARPSTSPHYSVGFEAKLTKGTHYPGRSRRAHFQAANEQLHAAFRADPAYAALMEKMYPGIVEGVRPGTRGAFPRRAPTSDVTWHHATDEGVMQLVPHSQHTAPGAVQHRLHPGGRGGMSIWGD